MTVLELVVTLAGVAVMVGLGVTLIVIVIMAVRGGRPSRKPKWTYHGAFGTVCGDDLFAVQDIGKRLDERFEHLKRPASYISAGRPLTVAEAQSLLAAITARREATRKPRLMLQPIAGEEPREHVATCRCGEVTSADIYRELVTKMGDHTLEAHGDDPDLELVVAEIAERRKGQPS